MASETIIPQILNQIQPTGGTAFRDALMGGCHMLINLHQFLQETGQGDTWNLVHVILTDGDDAGSKTSLMDAVKVMYVIGQLVNVKMLKIIFIGVGVSQKAQQEMQLLAKAGGENAEYYSANDANIGAIFQRITVKLGLEKRRNIIGVANNQGAAFLVRDEINPFLHIEQQSFAVLFNLDVSGSMSGQKWSSVVQSVSRFTNFLGDNDIIAAMVFNHEAKLLANMSPNDELFPKRLPPPRQYSPQPQQYYPPARQERAPLIQKEKGCCCQLI